MTRYQYYETIAGGSGAGPDHDGTERGADPHDQQPPDRSRRSWRRGCRCGSSGSRSAAARAARARITAATASIRDVTFLEPMRANILANRRRVAPRGLAGGGDALPGRNWVERADGTVEEC